jgi:hypothetical protein
METRQLVRDAMHHREAEGKLHKDILEVLKKYIKDTDIPEIKDTVEKFVDDLTKNLKEYLSK